MLMRRGRFLEYYTGDIPYNLALEHSILQLHESQPYIMTIRVWKNPQAVIIGRHQILENEVDLEYCKRNKIEIGRRISGGGAVYHDEGNVNISFFVPVRIFQGKFDVIRAKLFFTQLLVKSLRNVGIINVQIENGSNILYNGKKISGAAGYYRRNWYLHHATLLIAANLAHLKSSLKARDKNPKNPRASRYFPTTNLSRFDYDAWKSKLIEIVEDTWKIELSHGSLTKEETMLAKKLKQDLYATKKWIFEGKRKI